MRFGLLNWALCLRGSKSMRLQNLQVKDIRSKMFWSPFKVAKIHGMLNSYSPGNLLNIYSDFNCMTIEASKNKDVLEVISFSYEILTDTISREDIVDKATVNMFARYVMKANEPYPLTVESLDSRIKATLKDRLDSYVTSNVFNEDEMNSIMNGVWSNFVKVCLEGKQTFFCVNLDCTLTFDKHFSHKNNEIDLGSPIW